MRTRFHLLTIVLALFAALVLHDFESTAQIGATARFSEVTCTAHGESVRYTFSLEVHNAAGHRVWLAAEPRSTILPLPLAFMGDDTQRRYRSSKKHVHAWLALDIPADTITWQSEDRLTLTIPASVFPHGHMYNYPRLSIWMKDGDILGRTTLPHCLVSIDRARPLKISSMRPPESDFPALYYEPDRAMNGYAEYSGTTTITISRRDEDGSILSTNTYETGETGIWFNDPYTLDGETEPNAFNLEIVNVPNASDGGYYFESARAFMTTRDAQDSVMTEFWTYRVDDDGAIRGFLTQETVYDLVNILYMPA